MSAISKLFAAIDRYVAEAQKMAEQALILKAKYEQLQAENKRLNTIIDNRAEDKIILEKYKRLKGLLGVAICPNAMNGCRAGIIPNPNGEPEPCQWCAMTKRALQEKPK